MSKKKKKILKKSIKTSLFSKKNLALFILVFSIPLLIVFGINYFEAFKHQQEQQELTQSTQNLMDKMKRMLDDEKNRLLTSVDSDYNKTKEKYAKLPPLVKKETKKESEKRDDEHFSEISDYKKSLESVDKTKSVKVEKKKYVYKGKPKLAIIIDDVSYEHQVRKIQAIPYNITPSFFPPSPRHPDTVRLAKRFDFAMVHLPLQAISYARPEPQTFNTDTTKYTMKKRIRELKELFPHIKYYNNHTGSKFTSDFKAVDKLISVMKKENLIFVDSRTTAKTKVGEVSKKHGINLLSRDIFLDNNIDKSAIKNQLQKAVKLAKKHGFSIAIGHPHVNTLNVLKNANGILKDVEVVYIKDL